MNQEPMSQAVNNLIAKTQENLKQSPNCLDDHLKALLGIGQAAMAPNTMAAMVQLGGTNISILLAGFLHVGIKTVVGDTKFDELVNVLRSEFEAFEAGRVAGNGISLN